MTFGYWFSAYHFGEIAEEFKALWRVNVPERVDYCWQVRSGKINLCNFAIQCVCDLKKMFNFVAMPGETSACQDILKKRFLLYPCQGNGQFHTRRINRVTNAHCLPYIQVLYMHGRRGIAVYFVAGAWPYLLTDKQKKSLRFFHLNDEND